METLLASSPINHPITADPEFLYQQVVLNDDQAAFEKLFYQLNRQLMAIALPIIGSQQLAEEIVSDVFCALWKNRKVIQVHSSFKAYIFTSIRNKALDYLRKLKREKTIDLSYAVHVTYQDDTPEQKLDYEQMLVRVEQAIQALPQQCRSIFLLNREKGMKYKEIASQLNISVKTVETHMGRALRHLRNQLQPEPGKV